MCCLKHEQNVYEELLKITPKLNATVALADGTKGKVIESNTLTGDLKIQTEQSEIPVKCNRKDVTLLKDGKIRIHPEERNAFKELEGK